MSFASATFPSDPHRNNWRTEGESTLFAQIRKAGHFLRDLRVQMRFGELTRAPLRLIRFQLAGDVVECDWMARSLDPWDADLSRRIQQQHASLQTIRDAIDVRALLFDTLPQVELANLQVFRETTDFAPEMIIAGCVQRNDHSSREVHSIVMRAKVLGFRFRLEGESLRRI